jgi:acetyl-CoA carboxylase carboxyl transferase subunit beta
VKETIGKDLPEGFQTAEFVLEHGFLDIIVERRDLKLKIAQVVRLLMKQNCTPVVKNAL